MALGMIRLRYHIAAVSGVNVVRWTAHIGSRLIMPRVVL